MEFMLLSLISYLAAAAYLMAWIIRQCWSLQRKFRSWWRQRQAAGKILSLRSLKKSNHQPEIMLSFVGVAFGVLTAPWVVAWISREWLLLVLIASAILSEEFRPTQAAMNLLAVVILLDRVRVYNGSASDLFEVLSQVVQELPEGEVQKALWEALHRRRNGIAAEACLAILRGINSYLDEFILPLGCINCQTGSALTQITDRLHQRAARRWDRASRLMLLKDRIWPILHFVEIVIVGSIISLSVQGIAMHFIAWPSRITILLLGLALIATGLLLHFVLTSEWPRRVLVSALLLLALTPAMNTVHIRIPWWIQIHTITDISKNLSDSEPWKSSYPSQGQSKIIFQHSNNSVFAGPSNQHPFALPVPPPSPTPTKIIPSPISTRSISSEIEPEEICCHRVYQPK